MLKINGNEIFWFADAVKARKFDIQYYPGKEYLDDYQSKHYLGAHHTAVCPWYLYEKTSLQELPRASKPSTLRECVGILPDGMVHAYVGQKLTSLTPP